MPSPTPTFETIHVHEGTAKHGTVRASHGIELTFDIPRHVADAIHNRTYQSSFTCDFAGNIYGAIPIPGVESLAQWMLPLSMYTSHLQIHKKKQLTFTLGAKRLSRQRLMETLSNLQDQNDPYFSLDLTFTHKTGHKKIKNNPGQQHRVVLRAITSASHLLASLDTRANSIVDQSSDDCNIYEYKKLMEEADARREPKFGCRALWTLSRYLFLPFVFVCCCWWAVLATNPTPLTATQAVPRLVRFGMEHASENVTDLYGYTKTAPGIEYELPPLPKTRSLAFKLGAIWSKLRETGETTSLKDATTSRTLLNQASVLLDRPPATLQSVDQLTAVLTNLMAEDNDVTATVAQRVYGMFSTINVVWLCSIVGICVSIGPSIYYVLKPFREFLMRCATNLFEYVIEPTMRRCHEWGIFEASAWLLSSWVCLDAYRFYGRDAGRYIGITGACFSILAFLYSTMSNGGKVMAVLNIADAHERTKSMEHFVVRYAMVSCLPLALLFGSDFLGFIAVGAAFKQIGFGGWAGKFCYAIGFDDKDALIRCSFASLVLLGSVVGLKVWESSLALQLAPLQIPISVFGSLVLHIALLIVSSKFYKANGVPAAPYRNFLMIVVLCAGQFFGSAYAMEGLKNSSSVFIVLYAWTKSAELMDEMKLSPWIFILFTSVCLWRASLYLHVHPGLIAGLFTGLYV